MGSYTGIIQDKNGRPVVAKYARINSFSGGPDSAQITSDVFTTGADGRYSITLDTPYDFLDVLATGYKEKVYSNDDLTNSGGKIVMEPDFPLWQIAVVAAIALYIISEKKKKGGVGAIEKDDLITIAWIVGGVIAFSVIQRILIFLHLWDDPKDKQLDEESSNPNSPWNPNYWQKINPYGNSWTYALTEDQATDYATQLYDALGIFSDNEDKVTAVIHAMKTRANISFVAWEFQKKYNLDLLGYLRNGYGPFGWNGLSAALVTSLNNFVYNLPEY